jgi:hypothetical protein
MKQLCIEMIPAYSPEARGRSERAFGTHQDRLTKELAAAGITTIEQANQYLLDVYMPAYNKEFACPPQEKGSAFVPWVGPNLDDILCEQFERTVGKDNCVHFEGLCLQIPADQYRFNYVKVKVRIHRYLDGSLGLFHGPRKLSNYDSKGQVVTYRNQQDTFTIFSGGAAPPNPPRFYALQTDFREKKWRQRI